MIDIDKILEFAGNVTNIWTFLTFFVIVLVAGIIFLYKKDKDFLSKIFGSKQTEVNEKIVNHLVDLKKDISKQNKEIAEIRKDIDSLKEENKEVKKNISDIKNDVYTIQKDLNSIKNTDEQVIEIFNTKVYINKLIAELKTTAGVHDELINDVLNKFEGDFNVFIENVLVIKISNFTEYTIKEQLDRFFGIDKFEIEIEKKQQLYKIIENFRKRFSVEFGGFSQTILENSQQGLLLTKFKSLYKKMIPILVNQTIAVLKK
jgi:archaellum component FlaC